MTHRQMQLLIRSLSCCNLQRLEFITTINKPNNLECSEVLRIRNNNFNLREENHHSRWRS